MNPETLPDKIDTRAGVAAWRIADGKFRRGRNGQEEERDALLGRLVRVGVHDGVTPDGQEYAKLECDLERNGETLSVGANLKNAATGRPTYTTCIGLAQILLELKPGELVQLETRLGSQPNRYGKRSTFVNGYRVDPTTLRAEPIRAPRPAGEPDEVLAGLVARLRKHPAYAPRPRRADDDAVWSSDGRSRLDAILRRKGWPDTRVAEAEWLAMIRKAAHRQFPSLDEVGEDLWPELLQTVDRLERMPAALKAAAERAAAAVDYDPFADDD